VDDRSNDRSRGEEKRDERDSRDGRKDRARRAAIRSARAHPRSRSTSWRRSDCGRGARRVSFVSPRVPRGATLRAHCEPARSRRRRAVASSSSASVGADATRLRVFAAAAPPPRSSAARRARRHFVAHGDTARVSPPRHPRARRAKVVVESTASPRRARSRPPPSRAMRPLEESEIQQVFEKLFKFVGKNLKNIVDRADQPHCFRLHKKVRAGSSTRRRGATRDALVLPNSSRGNDERNPVVVILRALDDRSRSLPRSNAPPRATRRRRTRGDEEEISALLNASALKHKTISWLNFFN